MAESAGSNDVIPPRPPTSLYVSDLRKLAIKIVGDEPPIQSWMQRVRLDPLDGNDAVLAMGLVLGIPEGAPEVELELSRGG